jgi:hypothetical protein
MNLSGPNIQYDSVRNVSGGGGKGFYKISAGWR